MLKELKEKFTLIGAINRVAEALEEQNRLVRLLNRLPDPEGEAEWPLEPSVTVATDADSYEAELQDERRNRDR